MTQLQGPPGREGVTQRPPACRLAELGTGAECGVGRGKGREGPPGSWTADSGGRKWGQKGYERDVSRMHAKQMCRESGLSRSIRLLRGKPFLPNPPCKNRVAVRIKNSVPEVLAAGPAPTQTLDLWRLFSPANSPPSTAAPLPNQFTEEAPRYPG